MGENVQEDTIKKLVWSSVSAFILEKMKNRKGVVIQNLGTFTFSNQIVYENDNFYMRPTFVLAEKICQNFKIDFQSHKSKLAIPLVELNLSWVADKCACSRDRVQQDIKEIVHEFYASLGKSKNVDVIFSKIGKLLIRNGRSKMKFFTSFLLDLNYDEKKIKTQLQTSNTMTTNIPDSGHFVRVVKSSPTLDLPWIGNSPPTRDHCPTPVCEGTNGDRRRANEAKENNLCCPCLQRSRIQDDESLKNEQQLREQMREDEYYQHIMQQKRDSEKLDREVKSLRAKESQKVAAYNLGIAEAIRSLKSQHLPATDEFMTRGIPGNEGPKRKEYLEDLKRQIAANCEKRTEEKNSLFREERSNLLKLVDEVEKFNTSQERRRAEAMEEYKLELGKQLQRKGKVTQENKDEIQSCVFYLQQKRPEFYSRKIAEKTAKENLSKAKEVEEEMAQERKVQKMEEERMILEAKDSLHDEMISKFIKERTMKERNAQEWTSKSKQKQQMDMAERRERMEKNHLVLLDQCDYKRCMRCTRAFENKHRRNFFPNFNTRMGGMYII